MISPVWLCVSVTPLCGRCRLEDQQFKVILGCRRPESSKDSVITLMQGAGNRTRALMRNPQAMCDTRRKCVRMCNCGYSSPAVINIQIKSHCGRKNSFWLAVPEGRLIVVGRLRGTQGSHSFNHMQKTQEKARSEAGQ